MTYLLCRWMNEELRLSQVIEPQTFARHLSNGYLIGEILHKYDLLNDFTVFVNDDIKSSKVNNFSHLKATLQLLGISFDGTTAQELMQENQDVASHFIYELYVALKKKKKGKIGRTVANMIPNATSTHQRMKEQILVSEGVHRGFGLSANRKLSEMSSPIQNEDQKLDCKSMEAHSSQQKKSPRYTNKTKKQMYLATTFQQAKTVQKRQEQQRDREKQAQTLQNEIHQFEANARKQITSAKSEFLLMHSTKSDTVSTKHFNSEYIQQIRLRLELDTETQKQKERRSALFLEEQSKAQKAQQDAHFEDSLIKHLTRQTKEEEQLVAQFLQICSEKEVLIKNNLIRQQEIQKRREKDFKEALEKEAALARQERLANAAEIQKEQDSCKKLTAERKQKTYMKHVKICKEIIGQIVDLATKAADYCMLTGSLIPGKQMKEWKEVLFSGLPLYESTHEENKGLDPVELLKQNVLNKHDYEEYKNMVGEWTWPKTKKDEMAPKNSSIYDHVIMQLRNTVHPPSVTHFPPFSLKACVLSKTCSGKSTCLEKISQVHGVYVLSTDKLVEDVLNAYHINKEGLEQQEIVKNPSIGDDLSEDFLNAKFTKWALLGEAVNKVTGEGKAIPNEVLVDIVTETIKQLPANSAWILDGFPMNISQARLLEKALGGAVEEIGGVSNNPTVLTDPLKASAPALDLALFLDAPDESVASRTTNQTNKNMQAVKSSRIAAFEDTWPELEEWFGQKQKILFRLNANVDEEELFKAVESILTNASAGRLESSLKPNEFLSFVDDPLPMDTAASLCLLWDTVSESYENKVKAVLQDLRLQSTKIELHFLNYREEFKMYLDRADPKRELILEWQKYYNKCYLQKRKDKAKLQQRLDDLLEELWAVGDKRRQENEQKMVSVKEDEWLTACTSNYIQHHSQLLQLEIERFQNTLFVLKTYCLSMYRQRMAKKELQLPESTICHVEEQIEPIKPPRESLICDYEDAITTICSLISAEAELFQKELMQEDEKTLCPSTDKNIYSTFIQGPNDEQTDINLSETAVSGNAILNKIYSTYLVALNQAGDAAKARLTLIKCHDFEMLNALKSKTDQVINSLKILVKEQFDEEMRSIELVSELVRHHIESDPALQNALDLLSNFSHQSWDNSSEEHLK